MGLDIHNRSAGDMTTWSTIQKGFFSYQNRMLLPEVCRAVNDGPRTTGDKPQSRYAFTIGDDPTDDAMLPGVVALPRGRNLMRQTLYELDQAMPAFSSTATNVIHACKPQQETWSYGVTSKAWGTEYNAARTWRSCLTKMRAGADSFVNSVGYAPILQNIFVTITPSYTVKYGFAGDSPGATFPGFTEGTPPDVLYNSAFPGVAAIGYTNTGEPDYADGWMGCEPVPVAYTVSADWAAYLAVFEAITGHDGVQASITLEFELTSDDVSIGNGIGGTGLLSHTHVVSCETAISVTNISGYRWEVVLPVDGTDHEIIAEQTLSVTDTNPSSWLLPDDEWIGFALQWAGSVTGTKTIDYECIP